MNLATTVLLLLAVLVMITGLVLAWHAMRVNRALQHERDLAHATLHSIGDGVITADAAGRVEYMNPVAEQYTGWSRSEARGRLLAEIFNIADERSGDRLQTGESATGREDADTATVRLINRHGEKYPIRYSRAPIVGNDGSQDNGFIVVFHDVSQLRAMARQLIWQASHDALTELVNRREFERRLADFIETGKLGHEHAMLFMDLDGFKTVNDSSSHAAGDELLRQLARVMTEQVRGSDTLARLGGDEFGVLLESCPLDQAVRIANGIREAVREFRFPWEGRTFSVGVSIGLVPITAASGDVNHMLSIADACCYEAKSKGRNRVQVCRQEAPGAATATGLNGAENIIRALEEGEFRLCRQPIVPLAAAAGDQAQHFEVLVYLKIAGDGVDGDDGWVPSGSFLPLAERYNLLNTIERRVISSLVVHLHEQWQNNTAGRAAERGNYIFNLSGASLNDLSLPDFIRELLLRNPVLAGELYFGIGETAATANMTRMAQLMPELKALGCGFVLDDFGAGGSSLIRLKALPVDYLKIAGDVVRNVSADAVSAAIIEGISRVGHLLGMKTIASSVEDGATLARLEALGVDFAQGFFIARPEPFMQVPGRISVERKAG